MQLEQAITEAQDQHRRLKEQAANVIANQKQTEMRLNRSMADHEKLNTNARQALLMADEAQKAGDAERGGTSTTSAAEAFANQLIQLENEVGRPSPRPPVDPGVRAGQGRGRPELAARCSRSWPSARSC